MEYRLRTLAWAGGAVSCVLLTGFNQRRRGIRGVQLPVVLWTRSIHTFGMNRSVESVWIDRHGQVESIVRLRPGRLVIRRRPFVVVEAFDLDPGPKVGDRITALA